MLILLFATGPLVLALLMAAARGRGAHWVVGAGALLVSLAALGGTAYAVYATPGRRSAAMTPQDLVSLGLSCATAVAVPAFATGLAAVRFVPAPPRARPQHLAGLPAIAYAAALVGLLLGALVIMVALEPMCRGGCPGDVI